MSHSRPNRSRVWIACACLLWLGGVPLNAQEEAQQTRAQQGPVTLTSAVDRTATRVADPIKWTLRVEAPAGSRVGWPALPEQFDAWELRATERHDDVPLPAGPRHGMRLWTRTFSLETLKTGTHALPPVDVRVEVPDPEQSAERQSITVHSQPLSIAVESSLPADANPTQFRDIKGVVDVKPPKPDSTPWLPWIVVGCLVGLAALLAASHGIGRRRQRPAVWARKALARLRQMPAGSGAERQQRFAELLAVVRQFLAERFYPEVASQTAEEWLADAEARDLLDSESRSQVARLMKQHDLSRFAHTGVEPQQLDEAFATAEKLVTSAASAETARSSKAAIRNAVQMRSSA